MKQSKEYEEFIKVRQFYIAADGSDIDNHGIFYSSGNFSIILESYCEKISEKTAIALMCDSMENKLLSHGYGVRYSSTLSDGSFFVYIGGYQTNPPVRTKFEGLVQTCMNLPECLKKKQ
jgi:hypothetical protein